MAVPRASKYAWRPLLVVVAALSFFMVSSTPAHAHYVYANVWTRWTNTSNCVRAYAEISHGSDGNGYVKVGTASYKYMSLPSPLPCFYIHNRPPGWISAKWVLWKWSGSYWYVCTQSGTRYNTTTTYKLTLAHGWAHLSYPPCRAGWYQTVGYGYVYHNGTWYPSPAAGKIHSGTHYLPG
jgi:hypothetical protein